MAILTAATPPPQTDSYVPGLGRLFAPDPRDRAYPARKLLSMTVGTRPKRRPHFYWRPQAPIDQGRVASCVEHGYTHRYMGAPLMRRRNELPWTQHAYYEACKRRDEWLGEAYEGTSLRAGARYGQELGLIESYWWAWTVDDLLDLLLCLPADVPGAGGLVMGTNWSEGMDEPQGGVMRYTGRVLGGHCWYVYGASLEREQFRYQNSHRDNYRGWIGFEDVRRLLADDGEAVAVVEAQRPSPRP